MPSSKKVGPTGNDETCKMRAVKIKNYKGIKENTVSLKAEHIRDERN